MKKWIAIAFVSVGLVFLTVFLYSMSGRGDNQRSLGAVIQKYEFTELVPPSTLISPGTIVTVIKEDPLVVGVVCPASDALGPNLLQKLLVSDSASSKEAIELTGEFKLDISAQERITSKTDAKFVRKISVTLSNVRIVELPDSVVFDLVADRRNGCNESIQFRRNQGQKISMIKSVIIATAEYRLHFDANLDSELRAKMTRAVAGTLGLNNGVTSDDTIQGEGLIWGVRDDVSLTTISTTGPPKTGAAPGTRLLAKDKLAEVRSDAD